jgi:hypothetical protein
MADQPAIPSETGLRDRHDVAACWAFGPPGTEIPVRNAEALLAHLPVFLAGWPFRRIDDAGVFGAAIEIEERSAGRIAVRFDGRSGVETVFGNEFEAADGLADALVTGYVLRNKGLACLRAGSAQLGRGLVVLLGEAQSGKSSVALHMAAAGYRLFGEDRLAVRLAPEGMGAGICLGLTPKVRLPLPPDCGARLREYVDSFTEIRDDSTAYLKLWEGEAAGFPEEAPIAAIVVLEREKAGPCRLAPAMPADIVPALIDNCLAPDTDALVPPLTGLASRVAGYTLRFSSSREAASALLAALRDRPTGDAATSTVR